jgi:hypothetical protein
MDRLSFNAIRQTPASNLEQMLEQARQNPQAFEEQFKRTHPQAYQQAMQLRNNGGAKAAAMQMLQSKGIHPSILQMLGLK